MSTASADDHALMQAYAAGQAAAFEQLYVRHEQALYRFVRRLLGQAFAAQVDEVFQDTWLRVVAQRGHYRPQGAAFRTWLFTLAHHRCMDVLRKSGRELPVLAAQPDGDDDAAPFEPTGEPWLDWPAPAAATQDDTLFWRRAGERLLQCLEQLPTGQRAVFLLHHEDGTPLAELAQALELNFEAAKSRLRYAMARLRVCMGAYLPAAGA